MEVGGVDCFVVVSFSVDYAQAQSEDKCDYPRLNETLVVRGEVVSDVRTRCFYPQQVTGIHFVVVLQVHVHYQVQQIQQHKHTTHEYCFMLF